MALFRRAECGIEVIRIDAHQGADRIVRNGTMLFPDLRGPGSDARFDVPRRVGQQVILHDRIARNAQRMLGHGDGPAGAVLARNAVDQAGA